jgi:hypothetical protein
VRSYLWHARSGTLDTEGRGREGRINENVVTATGLCIGNEVELAYMYTSRRNVVYRTSEPRSFQHAGRRATLFTI